jgi:multidrug efflux system membrane fusion protein
MYGKVFLLGAALFLASCSKQKQVEPVVQVVRAGVAEEIRPGPEERYSVSIEPFEKVDLAFKSGGIVERILQVRGADGRMRNVQGGDRVAANAEVAQVRPLDYQHALEQAEAQHAQAQAQWAQAQAQRAQAQAELARARANFNTAQVEYVRASHLFQSASIVKQQYDEAKGRYEADSAAVAAAEEGVRAAEDGVKGAENGVAKAAAAVKEAKLSLRDTTLNAPFGGWITARNVDRGSLVDGKTIGFTIEDTHLVKAAFAIPDFRLSGIRRGQQQPVLLEPLGRTATGVVTSISPQADPQSRVFTVEVTLDNAREDIRPGMIGSLVLGRTRDWRPRLVVPLSAVVRAPGDPNGFAVFRLLERGGKLCASAQTIKIGETFGDSIEVTSGLSAGQKIISLGGAQLHDGQQVSVIP